jgi:hypothetical protein
MAAPSQRTKLTRIAIVVGGLLIAANLLLFSGLGSGDSSAPPLPSQIQQLYPNPQEVIRPQETVGADLRDDLQGVLYINRVQVPEDQLSGDQGLGIVTFRPGCVSTGPTSPGFECAYREFDPGTYNLQVEYWPRTESQSEARSKRHLGSYSWSIKVG